MEPDDFEDVGGGVDALVDGIGGEDMRGVWIGVSQEPG